MQCHSLGLRDKSRKNFILNLRQNLIAGKAGCIENAKGWRGKSRERSDLTDFDDGEQETRSKQEKLLGMNRREQEGIKGEEKRNERSIREEKQI